MGWEAGLAIDVMLLCFLAVPVGIVAGAVYLLVSLTRDARKPQDPLEKAARTAAEHEATARDLARGGARASRRR